MDTKKSKKISLSSTIGIVTLFCIFVVFATNLSTRGNIMIQVFLYWVTFGLAFIALITKKSYDYVDLTLVVFSIYVVCVTLLNQQMSFSDFFIAFGYITWWIWIIIIFKFLLSRKKSFVFYANTIAWFSIISGLYLITSYAIRLDDGQFGFVNNAYYSLCAIPILSLVNSKKLKIVSISICIISVLLSFKRSGIITLALILLFYILYNISNTNRFKIKGFFVIAIFLVLILNYDKISQFFGIDVFERFESLQETGGNGRGTIYLDSLRNISEGGIARFLFGAGYNGNIRTYGYEYSAHNDFIEVLVDYGVVGFSYYMILVCHFLGKFLKNIKLKTQLAVPSIVAICTFIVLSLFSHLVIYPSYFMFLIIYMCYVEYYTAKNTKSSELEGL